MAIIPSLAKKLFFRGRFVRIVVHVPNDTPSGECVFLSGAGTELGQWEASGKPLRQTSAGTWEVDVRIQPNEPLEFKVTRGTWDKVERHDDGSDTGNHYVEPALLTDGPVHHTVQRWSEAC